MGALADMEMFADALDQESASGATASAVGPRRSARADGRRELGRLARSAARSAVKWPGRVWGAVDVAIAAGSFAAAHYCSPRFSFEDGSAYAIPVGAAVFAASLLFASFVLGTYDRHTFMDVGRMAGRAAAVAAAAVGFTSLAFGWFGYLHIGRFVLAGTFALSAGGVFASRLTARELARHAKIRLVLVGPRRKFRPLVTRIRRLHANFYERPVYASPAAGRDPRGPGPTLSDLLDRHEPDEVVVMDDDPAVLDVLRDSARILRSGCAIFSHCAYYERLLREVPVDSIDERGVLRGGFDAGSLHTGLAKRPMDLVLASVGLLLAAPVMLACSALVRATSPGAVIYTQVRVGRYGRPFRIYKFRTMRADAEAGGAAWARSRDPRVTAAGAFLRRTRLDELPQLWNILRGEMSLVGPRPERPEFVEQLRRQIPHYDLRHLVRPGLTGWAQVRFKYGATVADAQRKLAFDLYYVCHCGLAFDAAICLRTLVAMARGAR